MCSNFNHSYNNLVGSLRWKNENKSNKVNMHSQFDSVRSHQKHKTLRNVAIYGFGFPPMWRKKCSRNVYASISNHYKKTEFEANIIWLYRIWKTCECAGIPGKIVLAGLITALCPRSKHTTATHQCSSPSSPCHKKRNLTNRPKWIYKTRYA